MTGPRAFAQRAQVVCDADGHPTGHLVEHAAMDLLVEHAAMDLLAEHAAMDLLADVLPRP